MSEIFLGRTQEIEKFTQAIDSLTIPEVSYQPYIFLYYGNSGIGKTTLLKKLKEVAEDRLKGNLNTIFLDWEKESYRIYDAQSREEIQPTTLLEVIYQSFCRAGKENYVEVSMREIYQRNQHPDAYKALKRYPDYDNNEKQSKYDGLNTEEYYNLFFAEIESNDNN
ncbi:MAG: ATP-binding protein [Cyanobacteria bacterium J06633_8]